MNVYQYKLSESSGVNEQPKSPSRGAISDLDEVVQQSSSMQEGASKKEVVEDSNKSILFFGFNQVNSLFAVGTEQGFYVYSTREPKERTKMCRLMF